jgi:predicted nucleic-acid-binding protein
MQVLDTSALIRFFSNDLPAKGRTVRLLLESTEKVFIPDVVFLELEYVLRSSVYAVERADILEAFHFLISRKQTQVSSQVRAAVAIFSQTTLDMADCIVLASALGNSLVSFDTKLLLEHARRSSN